MSYESMAHEEAREDAYKDGWNDALRAVRDALWKRAVAYRDLRLTEGARLGPDQFPCERECFDIVSELFGEGGQFEVKE